MSHQANRAALFGSKAGASSAPPRTVTTSSTTTSTPAPVTTTGSKTAGMKAAPATTKGIPGLSAEARRKKQDEAKGLVERGNAAMKTSVFQWSPDYLVAAPLYEQAADLYKQIGEGDASYEYYLKAAQCHALSKAQASSALTYVKASTVASELLGDRKRACESLQQAADAWAAYGDISRYADCLHKIAKQVRRIDVVNSHE